MPLAIEALIPVTLTVFIGFWPATILMWVKCLGGH